jgi:hypothetical protein
LRPLFTDLLASDEARTIPKTIIKTLSTTGGVGQTLIAGAAGSGLGGLPIGIGAAGLNIYLQSPQGTKALSDALVSQILQGSLKGAARAGKAISEVVPRATGPLFRQFNPDEDHESPSGSLRSDQSEAQLQTRTQGQVTQSPQASPNYNPVSYQTQQRPEDVAFEVLKRAVIAQESGGNSKATSSKGAQGLMQLMPATGREWHGKLGLPGKYDPYDPAQNEAIGSAYLKYLLNEFDGDYELAIASYNAGIGKVRRLLEKTSASSFDEIKQLLPRETQEYVSAIDRAFSSVSL